MVSTLGVMRAVLALEDMMDATDLHVIPTQSLI
jgi:hypothetical protein